MMMVRATDSTYAPIAALPLRVDGIVLPSIAGFAAHIRPRAAAA